MNRKLLSSAGLMLSFLSASSLADQVQINITANVIAKTCSISAGTKDFLVNLAPGNLRGVAVGVPFSYSPFSIDLEDCASGINTAHVSFSGESDPAMPNLLKIASGGASGIAIGLYDSDKKNIDIRNNITDFSINHSGTKTALNFLAAYLKTSDTASAGKVQSVASFEIAYD